MHATLATLIDRLGSSAIAGTNVIPWGSPVPSFGNLATSKVATLGLNPSNREFVDDSGKELQGPFQRFHTLRSLGIRSWDEVDTRHLNLILGSCRDYFLGNPYDRWFKKLDHVISGTRASYYDVSCSACHLDLIPYATQRKWTELTNDERSSLSAVAGDALAVLLRDSPVRVLILNGKSVVNQFEQLADVQLNMTEMPEWSLPRRSGHDVKGIAYTGTLDTLLGVGLGHKLLVLGFNHNIQSSFGVTTEVLNSIRRWIGRTANKAAR